MLRTGENLLSSWCLWFLPVLGSSNCVPSAPQQGEKLETNSCCSWHGQTRYFPKSLSVQHQERGRDWRASVALFWSIHIPIFKFCSHLSFYPICKCETATTTTLQNIIDIYCVVRDSSWQQYQHFFPFFPTRKKWERCRVTTWLPIWCREDFLGGSPFAMGVPRRFLEEWPEPSPVSAVPTNSGTICPVPTSLQEKDSVGWKTQWNARNVLPNTPKWTLNTWEKLKLPKFHLMDSLNILGSPFKPWWILALVEQEDEHVNLAQVQFCYK